MDDEEMGSQLMMRHEPQHNHIFGHEFTYDSSDYEIFLHSVHDDSNQEEQSRDGYSGNTQAFRVAPLFTTPVHAFAKMRIDSMATDLRPIYPQCGLLGSIVGGDDAARTSVADLVFTNSNEPWSAFICGSQGSGKSHTLSVLLENALLRAPVVNVTTTPAAGIVFHYDSLSTHRAGQICEAAYLCSTGVPVNVLVCSTSLETMKKRYEQLPGLPPGAPRPKVVPFLLEDRQLSTEIMMALMAVSDVSKHMPLYIASIRQLLRDMVSERPKDPVIDYADFLRRLEGLKLTSDQLSPLRLRLHLLQSMLVGRRDLAGTARSSLDIWHAPPGSLTIVDLSDPFVTKSDACTMFSVALTLFMGAWQSAPRVVVLDEAHKFLVDSPEAAGLTSDLISVIRQQRHLGTRVIVATQEPTVSKDLLALCNVSIIHRFTSPQWYVTLQQHLSGFAPDMKSPISLGDIVGLKTGHAFVSCPTAVTGITHERYAPRFLRRESLCIAVRNRLSVDGGRSVSSDQQHGLQLFPLWAGTDLPRSDHHHPASDQHDPQHRNVGVLAPSTETIDKQVYHQPSKHMSKSPIPPTKLDGGVAIPKPDSLALVARAPCATTAVAPLVIVRADQSSGKGKKSNKGQVKDKKNTKKKGKGKDT